MVVSPDLLSDRDALAMTCDVNGERRQDGTTADLVFDVPVLIEYISSIVTLSARRRDLHRHARWRRRGAGSVPEARRRHHTSIEGIGTMVNHCR